ncbi:putative transcription factor interactor and regulator LIM family [Helianthus annuus]|nr:putative transcription factor interactor and regulator LIM family [Helianthus annuus]
MSFSGTVQKCKACDKTVHFVEMISADGVPYHKTCFRCVQCNGKLVMSSYFQLDGTLYCKPHFDQKFKEMGGTSRMPCELFYDFTKSKPLKWSLRFGYFCHFSPKLKSFESVSMWFQFCCHFHPKANLVRFFR